MSAVDSPRRPAARPTARGSLVALYRLLLRTQITVPRLLGIAALGALSIVIGVFARWDSDPAQAATDAVSSYGLGLVVPLAALWLGTSAIGDLVEDRLLVYLWLKPVPRWQLPAAAVLATASVVVPLAALPVAATALVAGAGDVALPALLAASLAGLAYAGVFVAARLLVSARGVVGARVRAPVGERRCQPRRGLGSVHRRRLGELDPRDRARRGRDALGGLGCRRVRRAPGGGTRRLAGRDVALPPMPTSIEPATRSSARGASAAARDR